MVINLPTLCGWNFVIESEYNFLTQIWEQISEVASELIPYNGNMIVVFAEALSKCPLRS